MAEEKIERYAQRITRDQSIIKQALCETCQVTTTFGIRHNLYLLDVDKEFAMFKNENPVGDIVIINLKEIKALEFKNDEESEDGEHLSD